MVSRTTLTLVITVGVGAGCGGKGGAKGDGGADGPTVTSAWTARDLGVGRCVAINGGGVLLGLDEAGGTFTVTADGTRTPLGAWQAGAMAIGSAIADDGTVVGYGESKAGRTAIRWKDGVWSVIAGLSPGWSAAVGIGPDGRVVGVKSHGAPGELIGFVVAPDGTVGALPGAPTALGSAGYLATAASAIGIVETASGETHAAVFAGAAPRDLGTLGGPTSLPYGANARGDVVGVAENATKVGRAFLSRASGGALVDLGVAPAAVSSEARGIDDAGDVAGNVYDRLGVARPVIFVPGKTPVEIMPVDASGKRWLAARVAAMAGDGKLAGWGLPPAGADGGAEDLHCVLWTKEK
jgi:uncharacterized membrane protein